MRWLGTYLATARLLLPGRAMEDTRFVPTHLQATRPHSRRRQLDFDCVSARHGVLRAAQRAAWARTCVRGGLYHVSNNVTRLPRLCHRADHLIPRRKGHGSAGLNEAQHRPDTDGGRQCGDSPGRSN